MKYSELINFEPITTVIELVSANEPSKAESLVSSFVFSPNLVAELFPKVVKNLWLKDHRSSDEKRSRSDGFETRGIQIVGSYGTGKSHLMSVVSLIAEDAKLLDLVKDEEIRAGFEPIAGKYKVLRFEMGSGLSLREILYGRLEKFLDNLGVQFRFERTTILSLKEQLQEMMAAFEEKYPDKSFLVVIDELLEYLKGRNPTELNNDLSVLRQVGEACNGTRFRFMTGVQELLYRSPEFQFAIEMLQKVEARFDDLVITKVDISYVVQERLLKKTIHQKEKIQDHILKFAPLFDGINNKLKEFVDLFPVHPEFINHFEKIKHGKHQREILKVLSNSFNRMKDLDVPEYEPGLITYDQYWEEFASPATQTAQDIRVVKDKMGLIEDNADNFFTHGRETRKATALKMAKALAIRILCDDLDKKNGASAYTLKEDLCLVIPGITDPELLLATLESTAKQLKQSTLGQYVDEDENGNFYIRTEGGLNIAQIVEDYAFEYLKKKPDQADQYFFDFLQYILGIQQNSYRTGFKIWQHSLTWQTKKSYRLGYIFFGNPNERSTTIPIQQYYIYYSPVFNSINRNDEPDEVYFDMSGFSDEFRNTILKYGAAKAKEASATSDQKKLFQNQLEVHRDRAKTIFLKEYVDNTSVIYRGESKPLRSFPLKGEDHSLDLILTSVAGGILDKYFNEKYPDYPAFKTLAHPLTQENLEARTKSALKKITDPDKQNSEGEAILNGLGLWNGKSVEIDNSRYAGRVIERLKEAGEGSVLNREEILRIHNEDQKLYYSTDHELEYQLLFVVLVALVYRGDIEISWSSGRVLTAANINDVTGLKSDDYFSFSLVKQPKDIPYRTIKALFNLLALPDLSNQIEQKETIQKILTSTEEKQKRVLSTLEILKPGLKCRGIDLLQVDENSVISGKLNELRANFDRILSFKNPGSLKSFNLTEDDLKNAGESFKLCDRIEALKKRADDFEKLTLYLSSALSHLPGELPLSEKIREGLDRLQGVITSDDTAKMKQYEALLKAYKKEYVDIYLEYYRKYRLSGPDFREREKILASDSKKLCDILKDLELGDRNGYEKLITEISNLKEADPSMSEEKLEVDPYQSFSPAEYYGKPLPKVPLLREQLEDFLERWQDGTVSLLKDPGLEENLQILSPDDISLRDRLITRQEEVTLENAAKVRDLIAELMQGIEKVVLSIEDITGLFDKPMSPADVQQKFTGLIDEITKGKERNKVRIILKQKS